MILCEDPAGERIVSPSQPLRVVVADDDPDDRADVRRCLLCGSDRRYSFAEAETAKDTVRVVLTDPDRPPDCLVLDHHLPDADAAEVLADLVGPDGGCVCPVVVLTGGEGRTTGGEVLRAGAQDFVGKAWMTAESITRAVESAIERHRMARELRKREAALRRSEARYRLLADALPHMTWVIRTDRSFEYANRTFTACTGLGLDALDASSWAALVHPEDWERFCEQVHGGLARREPFEIEHRLRWHDGSHRWVLSRAVPMMDTEGNVERWVGTTTDIDARRRAEESLRDADRRKNEFLATLAHELRNPLAPIRNGLEILRLGATGDAAKRAQAMMERQLSHLVRLVDDLLDVSRISRGLVELKPQRVQVRTILEHAMETTRPLVEAGGHVLFVRVPDEPVWVYGDLTRLAQVVANLLNNAAKYTPHHGRIEVSAVVQGHEVVVCVADDGIGIAADVLPRVFDLFAQVDGTRHWSQGGLGIGLWLVRKLVELHGGSIVAESPGIGHGSTFTVRLPLACDAEDGTVVARPSWHRLGSAPAVRRVLVVDDNADAAETLAMLLELSGHAVETAHDGVRAIELARLRRPDVVFLDLGMPELDGYEVARRLRADPRTDQVMLVALTGWGSDDDKRRSREAGFDLHMTKPVDPAALADVLTRLDSHVRAESGAPTKGC